MTIDATSHMQQSEKVQTKGVSVRVLHLLFLALLLAVFFSHPSVPAGGQFDSASVLGTIKDPSGAAIPSATVQLLNTAKGITVTRQTDGNGDYEFTNVQPGDYSITVTAPGFEKAETDRFTVTV